MKNTTHYEIKTKAFRIHVWYRLGKLCRYENKNGDDVAAYKYMRNELPFNEHNIDLNEAQKITKEESPAAYKDFVAAWHQFYIRQFEFKPKFTGADGRATKQIIDYLTRIGGSQENALKLWHAILQNWSKLDQFTQSKAELLYINSHLNNIIIQLKHGKTGKKRTKHDADAIRQSF